MKSRALPGRRRREHTRPGRRISGKAPIGASQIEHKTTPIMTPGDMVIVSVTPAWKSGITRGDGGQVVEAPPMPWDRQPPPSLRVPGIGGAALTFTASVSPAALDGSLGAMGVDIHLMTPDYGAEYRRRPVDGDFCDRLQRFLWSAASDFTPQDLEPFEETFAGLSIRVLASSDFTVTLEVEVVAHEDEDGEREIDGIHFETSRAALITASELVGDLAVREDTHVWRLGEPELPLDLLFQPEKLRLTGVYRLPTWLYDRGTLAVTHLVRYEDSAEGELETSFLTSLLPFATVAAHGVDEQRRPWAVVTQVLPEAADASVASPWIPEIAAREEVNRAVGNIDGAYILGETIASRSELIDLFGTRGVDATLVEDWSIYDLCLAGIAELTNAPLPAIAHGRLTGCAFPDVPHDCPKDVFDCTFTRWQEMLFNRNVNPN